MKSRFAPLATAATPPKASRRGARGYSRNAQRGSGQAQIPRIERRTSPRRTTPSAWRVGQLIEAVLDRRSHGGYHCVMDVATGAAVGALSGLVAIMVVAEPGSPGLPPVRYYHNERTATSNQTRDGRAPDCVTRRDRPTRARRDAQGATRALCAAGTDLGAPTTTARFRSGWDRPSHNRTSSPT